MKKIIILLVGLILPLAFFAQDTPLSEVFEKYAGKKGYESKEIIPSEMSMDWEGEKSPETIQDVMGKISAIRIINAEGKKIKSLWKSVADALSRADYTEFLNVKAGEESVSLYGLKLDNGSMREFALTVKEEEEAMLLTISGDMDMSDISLGDIMKDMKKLKGSHGAECPKKGL
jgi:hypothetical protein